jgi:hypothetical protein
MKFPGVAGTEKGVTGNVIEGNRFEINRDVPFQNLHAHEQLILLQIRDSGQGHVTNNFYFGNQIKLTHSQAVEFAVTPGCEPFRTGQTPHLRIPKYHALGRNHPVGARKQLRGRDQIIMNEWGPWDHEAQREKRND